MSTWKNPGAKSKRSQELPANWDTEIRPSVKDRDGYRCTALLDTGTRCPEPGTDVDHINDPHDHRLENMRLLCGWHHHHRTATQGAQARAETQQKLKHPSTRSLPPGMRTESNG